MPVDQISNLQTGPAALWGGQRTATAGRLGDDGVELLPPGQGIDIQSAAEELGMARAERREPTLEELEPEPHKPPDVPDVEALERVWLEAGGEGEGDLQRQAGQLLDMARQRGPLLAKLAGQDGDPTRQQLLLMAAWRMAKRRGPMDAAAAEVLEDALEQLEEEAGPKIRAGLNTTAQAKAFSRTRAGQDAFRGAYRDAVLLGESLPKMFKLVLSRFGEERFEEGMRLLVDALAADLKSVKPSTEPVRLHAIFSDLYLLQSCNTVLQGARSVSRRMEPFGAELKASGLAESVVGVCTDGMVGAWSFHGMASGLGVDGDDASRVFLGEVMSLVRRMPEKLFPSPEHRLQAIDAAQEALDRYTKKD